MNSVLRTSSSTRSGLVSPLRASLIFLLLLLGSVVAQAQNTWTGLASTDWNTATNWSGGRVPLATDDAVIPSAPARQPVLSTTAVAKSVEVQSGASLSIASAGTLVINGFRTDGGNTMAFYNAGTVANSGLLLIGNSVTANVGKSGIFNRGGTFHNNTGGSIAIDRTTDEGIFIVSGSFTNAATIAIGAVASVGEYGIWNNGTLLNDAGGRITIDQTTITGLVNSSGSSNRITNLAIIIIGVGGNGISNGARFENTGCGALINVLANAVITNSLGQTFNNSGTIIENASGTSNISSNAGIVQNLNGGTFTIGTNTGVLTTSPGPLPTITATPSLTITQGQSATLTASGATSYSWSTGETTPAITVSAGGPYSVTGTTGGCSSTATVSMTVKPVPTFTVSNPAICSGQYVNLGNSIGNKSPNNGDLTYYTTQANAQAGTNALISGLVGPVNTPTTYYARYDAEGSFSTQPIMVTLKPALPAPPVLTQNGHAYMGGVASVTVAQNSESVILAVPGCDGTVSWSGPNNFVSFASTISLPTSTTGSFTYQASCSSQTACYSGSSQATITVNVVVPPCGTVVYVTPGGAGSQNGSSWTNAFSGTALQTAINTAAGCGAQVWVAAGLYKPTTTTGPNSRTISFSMANGVAIYGGFTGNEPSLVARVLTYPSSTTLSGDIGSVGDNSDNSYNVIRNGSLNSTAVLDGFVITGGNANNSPNNIGGAMYNNGSNGGNSSPTLTNCAFINNSASSQGGAIFNKGNNGGNSSPKLTNCAFINNSADFGGAMYNDGNFNGNSSPTLTNSSFLNNSATTVGRAIYNNSPGGISSPILTNCVLFGNAGSSAIFGSNVLASYSLFENGVTGFTDNGNNITGVTTSPFASTASVALVTCSPAINAGLTSANSTTVDLAGQPRLVGSRIDMGAVEYQGSTTLAVGITPNPSLTIGVGQSVTLTASGADSYRWSAGVSTTTISVSVAGPYSVTGTTGSCSGTATVSVTTATPACGTVVYVTQAGAGLQDGSSWTNAFSGTALQTAINTAAGCGAQVWVAQGTYKPTTSTNRAISFAMKNGVAIYGGLAGTEPPGYNMASRDLVANRTTLSGDLGTQGNTGDNSYHIISNPAGLTSTAILDGFVITGGNANGNNTDGYGGGIYNNGSGSGNFCNPQIRHCSFVANSAGSGGAMYNYGVQGNSSPSLINCSFQNNQALGGSTNDGGAMYNDGRGYSTPGPGVGTSSPSLTNCTFLSNSASRYGGAMYNDGSGYGGTSSPSLTNCTFQANFASNTGGAMFNFGYSYGTSSPRLTNCTFQANTASINGGAMYSESAFSGTSSPSLTNCAFQNNTAPTGGAMANSSSRSTISLTNCVLFGNGGNNTFYNAGGTVTATYSLFDNTVTGYNSDPTNLTTTTSPFTSTSSTELRAGSPAIDAGSNSAYTTANGPATDLAGNPRFYPSNGRIDMGAYEFQGNASLSLVTSATPNPVCAGSTVALSVTASGGTAPYSYTWAAPAGITLSATSTSAVSASVSAGLSGPQTFTITVAASGGSPTSTSLVSLTVNALPTISIAANPSLTVTQGQSATLTASGANSYSWSNGQSTSAISVSVAGPYSVTGTIGSCASVTTVTLTVNAPVCGAGLSGPIWTGCVSRDWNTAGNWASGTVPAATDDVVIPSGPTNQPILSTPATAKSVEVQSGASLSITAVGSLAINSFATLGGFPGAFYNQGTVNNNGTLMLGNTAPVGLIGLHNIGTFTNTGTLQVDRATNQGINNRDRATFTNTGNIIIGASVPMGTQGIWNQATFIHTGGTITIDRITGDGLLNSGNFVNSATITIGASASVTGNGLTNNPGASFTNATGGTITIDRTGVYGLANTFTATFINSSTITIGSLGTIGNYGIVNPGLFTNSACATLTLLAPIFNNSNSFTNAGLLTVNTTRTHIDNGTLTNNGIIDYPQGNPVPNVTNNDVIAAPVSSCSSTINPALQLGGNSNQFTVATTWYKDQALTQPAGTYNQTSNTFTATNLAPGSSTTLYFAATDNANGCTKTVSVSVTINSVLTASITASPSLTVCQGASVTLTASGAAGDPGTSYRWNNGQTTQAIVINTNDPSGNPGPGGGYSGPGGPQSVTVTNAAGCSASATVTLTINAIPVASISPANLTVCQGQPASLTASGGSGYLWSTGQTTAIINVTATGTYSVTVSGETGPVGATGVSGGRRTAGEGCFATATSTVTVNPLPANASLSSGTLSCANTSVTLTATATGASSYTLSNGQPGLRMANNTGQFVVNQPGAYTVTIANASGCTAMASTSVSSSTAAPVATLVSSGSLSCSVSSVTLTASPSGLSYTFSGPGVVSQGGNMAVVNAAGTYSVTVLSGNGCSSVASTSVSSSTAAPVASLVSSGSLTCSVSSVTLTASGGTSYAFYGPGGAVLLGSGATRVVSNPGTYSVTVTNAGGCTSGASVSVAQDNTAPTASLVSSGSLTCSVSSVTLTASPGGQNYQFSGPGVVSQSGNTALVNVSGQYSVTVMSGNGCSSVANVGVSQDTTTPTATLVSSGSLNCAVSSVTLTANAGTGLTYQFSGPGLVSQSGNTVVVNASGTYSVTVTSANGCKAVASTPISQNTTTPSATLVSSGSLTCSVTSVTLTASPSGQTYIFSGPGVVSQSGNTALVNASGPYSVTVLSGNGCYSLASTSVSQDNTVPTVSIGANPSLTIAQGQTAILTASVLGSNAPLAFAWSTGQTTSAISVSTAATYQVTVTGANGCSATASVVLSVTAAPVVSGPFAITGVSLVSCTSINEFRRVVSINPQYAGLDGSPVSFSVANELRASTDGGPYSLQLYVDNPVITLVAVQGGVVTSFAYNWLSACNSGVTPPPSVSNTAPTVVSSVGSQTVTVGSYVNLNLTGVFTDAETPSGLVLTVSGLPAGLSLSGSTISGIPSASGVSAIILTATDPGGLSVSTGFGLTVLPAPAGNTAPVVANGVGPQSTTAGQFFTLSVATVFTDAETPNALTLSVRGLPAGLSLSGTTISGSPVGAGVSTVILTATDPGNLSGSTSFVLTVTAPVSPTGTGPFSIVGVSTISCTPIVAGRIDISFTPQYSGLDGSGVRFQVANELAPTTAPAPYSLQLYVDNPTIRLQAVQGGAGSSFDYNWLAACQNGGTPTPGNTAPTVVNAVGPQSATVGVGYTLNLASVFTDAETPGNLMLRAGGLPAGLNLTGTTISGSPSVTGTTTITLTATDPGGLSVSTGFQLVVSPAGSLTTTPPVTPPAGFAITGVGSVSCAVVSGGQRRVTFSPQYAGLTGQPITFSVVNELGATTNTGPYSLNLYTDNPSITLKASQAGTVGEASFAYNWLASCNSAGSRVGAEPGEFLNVRVLGNPVVSETVAVEVRGALGHRLVLSVLSERGGVVSEVTREEAGLVERLELRVGREAGVYLLRVGIPGQSQTVKLLKF